MVSDSVVDVDVEVVEDLTLVSEVEDTEGLSMVEVVVTESCTTVSVSVSVWISVAVVIASAWIPESLSDSINHTRLNPREREMDVAGSRNRSFHWWWMPAPGKENQLTDVVFDVDDVVFELPPAVPEGEALRAM